MSGAARILAFDSAGSACSAALYRDGRIASRRFEAMSRGHSEALVPMIQAVMAEADLSYADLDLIAVTLGPGGFTGVRIGLATARGVALAAGRPLLGVTNFEAVAHAVPAAERRGRDLAVVLDAKRAEVYVQLFPDGDSRRPPPMLIAPESLAGRLTERPVLLAGDAVDRVSPFMTRSGADLRCAQTLGPTDAAHVATLAAARPAPGLDEPLPDPLYLRAPDVTQPRAAPRKGSRQASHLP